MGKIDKLVQPRVHSVDSEFLFFYMICGEVMKAFFKYNLADPQLCANIEIKYVRCSSIDFES